MTTKPYPQPRRDADNRAFLEGWRSGRLLLQRCAACRQTIFYPRPCCPYCWSERIEEVESAGRGIVVSYSLVRRPNDAAFNDEVPIILAEVEVTEGARLLARILDIPPEAVRRGLAVALLDSLRAARFPLPAFRPSSD